MGHEGYLQHSLPRWDSWSRTKCKEKHPQLLLALEFNKTMIRNLYGSSMHPTIMTVDLGDASVLVRLAEIVASLPGRVKLTRQPLSKYSLPQKEKRPTGLEFLRFSSIFLS